MLWKAHPNPAATLNPGFDPEEVSDVCDEIN